MSKHHNAGPLLTFQVDFTSKPQFWRSLHPQVKEKLGELLVSLSYFPSSNALTIGVLKVCSDRLSLLSQSSGSHTKMTPRVLKYFNYVFGQSNPSKATINYYYIF
jgi:hypothetical protein